MMNDKLFRDGLGRAYPSDLIDDLTPVQLVSLLHFLFNKNWKVSRNAIRIWRSENYKPLISQDSV
jgi:hypothetical protein